MLILCFPGLNHFKAQSCSTLEQATLYVELGLGPESCNQKMTKCLVAIISKVFYQLAPVGRDELFVIGNGVIIKGVVYKIQMANILLYS